MLRVKALDLIKDINGNHIIQKFVSIIQNSEFIYEMILQDFYNVVTDKHGCCVLQKCIEVSGPKHKTIMISIVVENTLLFMSDQYANYVLQFIISLNNFEVNRRITECFIPNIGLLGKHKFSSNVIEKVIYI
jgi:hypothetical protein